MRWHIYLALDILSIPFITSTVIRRDSSGAIDPFIGNSPFSPLSPEIDVSLKPNTGSTTPIRPCVLPNPGSINRIQKRQLFSPGSTSPDIRQNEEFGISAPVLISSDLGGGAGGASNICTPDDVRENGSGAASEEENNAEDPCPEFLYYERQTPICDDGLTIPSKFYVDLQPQYYLVNVKPFTGKSNHGNGSLTMKFFNQIFVCGDFH